MNNYNKELLTLLTLISLTCACPELCTCKWKSGKQTVECTNRGFLAIPQTIDPGTQVLEFSQNSLGTLQNKLFAKLGLINLQRIYLSDCGITNIHDRTFVGLTNLIELDLSNNLINAIPTEAFIDCPSLMRLTLSGNVINVVQKAAFLHLTYLTTLELDNCGLNKIEEGAFQGLHSLEWLHLNGNKLRSLSGTRILPESLKGVELQDNLWECDCHILDLKAWLVDFKIPQETEPKCSGPARHKNRYIKTVPESELACLPNVTPTSFYLELGEGRNISLLCHVNAIPEAKVSWWFQGQILQNDSLVAPGMRLIYYVEEGNYDRRSELFILNAKSEDNGTYVCNAENFAGRVEANFTIRVILKEEPIVIIVAFPFEYLIAAIAGVAALLFIFIIIIVISILRCRRNRRRQQKREKTKEIALQYQETKSCVDQQLKIIESEVELCIREDSPSLISTNQVSSPPTLLKSYQLEQNPDLINDTESVERRRDGDGEDNTTMESEIVNSITPPQNLIQFPVTCLIDREGYPVDYGVPKLYNNFYRTLPYNKRRQSAANPIARYSREAEFLSHQPEHYYNVRYTADGYPVRDPPDVPCCSNQWPQYMPANLHHNQQSKYANINNKRCVSAQTESEPTQPQEAGIEGESPDEGYGGETSAVV